MKKRNKLACIVDDVALPGEKGLNRFFYLAEFFCKYGFSVDLYTGNFQHWEKHFREPGSTRRIESKCRIITVPEYAYTKNLDLKRIFGYRKMAREIRDLVEKEQYDLIYCQIPDNNIASVMGRYAKKAGIPFVIDVEDLWPEAMKMVFHTPVISDILFSYFSVNAKKAYQCSDGVVGSSDDYRDESLKYGITIPKKETVYVGMDKKAYDAGAKENAGIVKKPENEFWVTYAGTLGASYDIGTLIRAAKMLEEQGEKDIRIQILGDGPMRDELEKLAKDIAAPVDFRGYMLYPQMAAYLNASDVTVNSIVKNAAQSIVSKIGDYLASGHPMINTCRNPEFWKKVEADGFGLNAEPENAEDMVKAILALKHNTEMYHKMSAAAKKTGEEQFDRNRSYIRIVNLVNDILGNEKDEVCV